MSDAEAIGVIIDDIIDVLYDLYNDNENDCYLYVMNVLKYINYLCDEENINFNMKYKLDKDYIKLIELHRMCI